MKAFTPLVLIGLTFAAYFMYAKPTFEEVKLLQAKKERFLNVLEKAKDLGSKRDAILADYQKVPPEKIERLKQVVAQEFNSVTIAKDINTMAIKNGIVLKNIKIAEPQPDSRYIAENSSGVEVKKAIITFNFKGSYDQFVKFVKDLESSLFLIDVTGLSIRGSMPLAGAKIQSSLVYDYSVELHTYSF